MVWEWGNNYFISEHQKQPLSQIKIGKACFKFLWCSPTGRWEEWLMGFSELSGPTQNSPLTGSKQSSMALLLWWMGIADRNVATIFSGCKWLAIHHPLLHSLISRMHSCIQPCRAWVTSMLLHECKHENIVYVVSGWYMWSYIATDTSVYRIASYRYFCEFNNIS